MTDTKRTFIRKAYLLTTNPISKRTLFSTTIYELILFIV